MRLPFAAVFVSLLFPLPSRADDGQTATIQWSMKPHDYVHYRCQWWQEHKGKPVLWDHLEHPIDVFGCDFDKEGRYRPRLQDLNDLPVMAAFQAPPKPVGQGDRWKVSFAIDTISSFPRLVVNGSAEYAGIQDLEGTSCHLWRGAATIEEAKGKRQSVSREWQSGKIEWKTWFEVDAGLVKRVELGFEAAHIGRPASPKEQPTLIKVKEQLDRKEFLRHRDPEFQKKVDNAIDKGLEWVKSHQEAEGGWGAYYDYKVGPTALALLTLMKGGVSHSDPAVEKGLAWLRKQSFTKTYEVSLSIMAVEAFYIPASESDMIRRGQIKEFKRNLSREDRDWMERAMDWLVQNGRDTGMWGYPSGADLSNTQYGILGLHAAGRCGIWAPEDTWLDALHYLLSAQQSKGPEVKFSPRVGGGTKTEVMAEARGWGYARDWEPTASMTCAGLACVALCRDALVRTKSRKWTPRDAGKTTSAIRDGIGWLVEHYDVRGNDPIGRGWYFYYLYGLERAGTLAEFDLLGGHDWYYEGALVLIYNQHREGHWQDSAWCWLHDTCFAILFLKRATTGLPTK